MHSCTSDSDRECPTLLFAVAAIDRRVWTTEKMYLENRDVFGQQSRVVAVTNDALAPIHALQYTS
jgi:hypothetical protein